MMMPTKEESQKGAAVALVEYNKNIISSWLERFSYPFAKIQYIGPEYAEIAVRGGGDTKIFGLSFGKIGRRREFRINPICMDAFDKDDKCQIEKIKVIGCFVEHMDDIEKDLIGTYKARRLYVAWSKAWNALYGNKK